MRALSFLFAFMAATSEVHAENPLWDDGEIPHHRYDEDYYDRFAEIPVPTRTLARDDVEGLLSTAGLEACLAELPGPHRATVRARVETDGSVHVEASVTPADDDAALCVRRSAEAVLGWSPSEVRVPRRIRARAVVRSDGVPIPPPADLAAAVAAARPDLRACVGESASGTLELILRARSTGRVRLVSAHLGAFVPGEDATACLEGIVGTLRVEPSTTEVTVLIVVGTPDIPVAP